MAVGRPSGLGVDGSSSRSPLTSDTAPDSSSVLNDFLFGSVAAGLDVPTIGASTAKGYDNDTTATTAAITTGATTALLIFAQWETTATPPTITDNKGNTYPAPFRTIAPGAGSIPNFLGAWLLTPATGGANHIFTITGAASTFPSIWVVEVPGTESYTDVADDALASPYNSGPLTTTEDTRLVGFAGAENTTTVTHTVNSAGFTKIPGIEITDGAAAWTGTVAEREAVAGTYSFEVAITSSQDGASFLVALSKTPTSSGVVGTLAVTEGADTFAAAGVSINRGALVVTEGADTFAAAGVSINRGALVVTEGADSFAASGVSIERGTLAVTEGPDTFAADGIVVAAGGTLAVTEGADTLAATGVSIERGVLAVTEAGDTATGAGVSIERGVLAVTEAGDTLAATGVSINRGTLAVTEGADTFAATGVSINRGVLTVTEAGDTFAAAGVSIERGVLAVTEGADTLAATGVSINRGTLAVTEVGDTAAGTGVSIERGALAVTEEGDTFLGLGGAVAVGDLAVTEGADTFDATGFVVPGPVVGDLAATEAGDSVVATGAIGGAFAVTPAQALLLRKLYQLHGLDRSAPLAVSAGGRATGDVVQATSTVGAAVTLTTIAGHDTFYGDVGAMIEELAALHALTGPMTVTPTERTAPGIAQTLATTGGVTTVVRQ